MNRAWVRWLVCIVLAALIVLVLIWANYDGTGLVRPFGVTRIGIS